MPWARLDDRFHENRKVKRAWRRMPVSIGLHVMAITYCAGYCTDGLVDADFVEEKMPKDREREAAVAALVEAGLWVPDGDGWQINDFLEFNRSAEEIAALKQSKSDAGKKGAEARWGDGTRDGEPIAPPVADAMARAMDAAGTVHGSPMARPEPVGKTLEVGSPSTASDGARASGNGTSSPSDEDLAEEVRGSLDRVLDGLISGNRGRGPTKQAVLKVLRAHRPSPAHVETATLQARSIVQSQDEATNIVGLFEMKLIEAMGAAA